MSEQADTRSSPLQRVVLASVRSRREVYAIAGECRDEAWVSLRVPAELSLQQAWERVGQATTAGPELLCDVLRVLMQTVPELPAERPASPLPASWGAGASEPKRTAAHPRGFRGTKQKRAKTGRGEPIDLRPYLCDPGSMKRIGQVLNHHFNASRRQLLRQGFSAETIDWAAWELSGGAEAGQIWRLPLGFRLFVWPHSKLLPKTELARVLALYQELDLDTDRRLLEAWARLLALAGAERAMDWATTAKALPSERRVVFLHLVSDSGVWKQAAGDETDALVWEASGLAGDDRFAEWMRELLKVYERGEDASFFMAGLRLAEEFAPTYRFRDVGRCAGFPEEEVAEMARTTDPRHAAWIVMALWEACGWMPGLAKLLAASRWRDLDVETARGWVRFFAEFCYLKGRERGSQGKWKTLAGLLPEVEKRLTEFAPEYRGGVITFVDDCRCWSRDGTDLKQRVDRGFRLLRRLASPEFSKRMEVKPTFWSFLGLTHERDFERFLAAPAASFERLGRECERDNAAVMVQNGLQSLTIGLGRVTTEAFQSAPAKLCRAARKLGALPQPVRASIVKECGKNSLMRVNAAKARLEQVVEVVRARRTNRLTNPIPAQLNQWANGQLTLTPGRIERYGRVMAERLSLTRMDLVEEAVAERLKQGLPPAKIDSREEFALMLMSSVTYNRRGLRKFLRAYWSGDRDYLAKHPATEAWYRRRPQARRNVWEKGIRFDRDGYSLRVEQDPLEVLKLGEYVGSCLGLGGCNAASSVAALLDANKQVIYAREERGRIAARQLVAISDQNQLVCFSVYPRSADARMHALFRDYDLAFAEALGLPVYRPEETKEGYTVAMVLSEDWYDDYAWDLKIEGEEETMRQPRNTKG